MIEISGTPYSFHDSSLADFDDLARRVGEMRTNGKLTSAVLHRLRKYFRIKNIYHSNAIEGNQLNIGETRQVVEQGLTLTGRPLKDQAEARNLSGALDYLEELASGIGTPLSAHDVRQIHALVMKGIEDHAGAYRKVQVAIGGSAYEPPGPEKVPAEMDEFSRWLQRASLPDEAEIASAKGLLTAAAAHTWLVTIHPFADGNGRVARLLGNLLLMRYWFPIAIVSREDRHRYYDALEESQSTDLTPLLVLFAECVRESLEEYERAAEEQRERAEWAQELKERFTKPERIRIQNEYEVWRNAMELFRSFLHQTAELLSSDAGGVWVKDFGQLEVEKYTRMRGGAAAKRTWFCRLDFRRGEATARYLFFFGYASAALRKRCTVTLQVAREEPPGSYYYERLDGLTAPNVPDLREIGYDMKQERFVFRGQARSVSGRIEQLGRAFFNDVLRKHFSA